MSQTISHGAMRDVDKRDPPRCHPGIREKTAEGIVHWIEEPYIPSSVLWVNGRTSFGKLALMQTIAERRRTLRGVLFLPPRSVGLHQKRFLFSTLTYQLAMNIPGMVEYVDGDMTKDFLSRKSAAFQLQRLIVEPIRLLHILLHVPIIIIDGLDECEGLDSQYDIRSLVSHFSMDPSIPIRFVIASRPEHQIYSVFNKELPFSMTRRLVLDDEYDSASDIERYLRDKFARSGVAGDRNMIYAPSYTELHIRIYVSTIIEFVGSVTIFSPRREKSNPWHTQSRSYAGLSLFRT